MNKLRNNLLPHTVTLCRASIASQSARRLVLLLGATMNALFALSTSAGHFGGAAGDLTIATYGNEHGDIYINSNYSGFVLRNVILQPSGGEVGIGTTAPTAKLHVVGDNFASSIGVHSQGNFIGVKGESINGYAVFGTSTNNYAGYFLGDVLVTGTLTQGSDARAQARRKQSRLRPTGSAAAASRDLALERAIRSWVATRTHSASG